LGKNYVYAEQNEQLGTGHAVLSAKTVMDSEHEIVIVLAADQPVISKETLERIIQRHLEKKPIITIGTVVVPDFEETIKSVFSRSSFSATLRMVTGSVVSRICSLG